MSDKQELFKGFLLDLERVDKALRRAARHARLSHKRAGHPIVSWEGGRVVLIPPEAIRIGDADGGQVNDLTPSVHKYAVVINWSDEDQLFIAEVPELPGCVTHGATQIAALMNANEAAQLWIDAAEEAGNPVPQPRGRTGTHP